MVNLRSHTTRLGVLDIGSNTIHMLIVDAAPGARPDPEASTKSTVRLMKYLKDDGSIKKSGIEAILAAVAQCMKLAEEYGSLSCWSWPRPLCARRRTATR